MTSIIDWAGNVCFQGKTFADFDDAEEFLTEKLGDDYETDRSEYYIVDSALTRDANYLNPNDIRTKRKVAV